MAGTVSPDDGTAAAGDAVDDTPVAPGEGVTTAWFTGVALWLGAHAAAQMARAVAAQGRCRRFATRLMAPRWSAIHETLDENQIAPAAVLPAHLGHACDFSKAEARVKVQ